MTVLRGALLVDGTGAPPRPADVVIEADRIAAVEAPGTISGGNVVDLDGLALAPGFIDCHTHYDAQVLWDPDLTPSSWHYGSDFGPNEFAELSVKTGRPVTWTALTASPGAFRLLDAAEGRGGQVWPQVACRPIVFQVTLAEPAPLARVDAFAEVLSVPAAERARFYRDPAWRERARADIARQWKPGGWDKIFVQETAAHPELADGPSLAEIAAQRGVHPLDLTCDVALDKVWVNGVPADDGGPRAGRLIRDGGTAAGPAR
jgi:N-acyl-D-aspartate/D-glutamate deacylase